MEKILRLHWSVHFAASILLSIGMSVVFNSNGETRLLATCLFATHWMVYVLAIGSETQLRISNRIDYSFTLFQFNWAITILFIILLILATYIFEQKSFHFNGLQALPGFYIMFALLYTFLYSARNLKTVEKGERVTFGESIGAAMLLIFYPFNFLFIHKRVQKVLDKPIVR